MHRIASCLRTCRCPRLDRPLHSTNFQRLSNAGTGHQVDDEGKVIETLSSWEDHHAREVGRKPVDAQDVVIDDLSATLHAHRASNRASVIRKIAAPSDIPDLFLRPSINEKHQSEGSPSEDLTEGIALAKNGLKSGVTGDQAEQTQQGQIAGSRIWPADSVQAQEGYGRRSRKRVRKRAGDNFVKSRGVLEYTGVPFLPRGSWEYGRSSTPLLQRPWLAYMEESSGDHLETLAREIRAYEAYMRLTPAEEAAAQLVMSDVRSITRKSLRKAPLTMLGSRSTGLATPLSDFDLTFSIASPDNGCGDRGPSVFSRPLIRQAVDSLRDVEKDLRYSIKTQNTELVFARIPIIKTKHRGTGLRIQIQTMAHHQPAQEYVTAYLNELPSLRPLFIVLRYCLEIRGLTTVYEGGLGSYSLLMMIVNALKHSIGTFTSDDLAGQLLYVLYFYGSADLYQHGFSANPPRLFDKLKEKWSIRERLARSNDPQLRGIDEIVRGQNRRKPYLLSLQDPANDSNDLGRNSYAIKHVQAVFNKARQSILSALEQGQVQPEGHGKEGTWSYLDPLVRADYKSFEENRSKVEHFAKDRLSKDYDYSTRRITEDFQRRAQVYKGLLPSVENHLWEEWASIKRQTAKAEGLPLPATSEAQATPTRIKDKKPRQLNRETNAAEIAKAQEIKHLTPSLANFEKRFRVLHAKTEHFRKERNTIAMEVARSGRIPLTGGAARRRFNRDTRAVKLVESLRKDDNGNMTSIIIQKWYEMLRRKFCDLRRESLYISRRVDSLNGEDSGVADLQSRYERLRRVKDDYGREFNTISRRLASLKGQDTPIAATKDPLSGSRRELRKRLKDVQAEMKVTRQGDFELETLRKRDGTDANYATDVANLEESKRRRRELTSELRNIEAAFTGTRRRDRIDMVEKQRGNQRALEEPAKFARFESTSLVFGTAPVIDRLAVQAANAKNEVQLQEAVEASVSRNNTAADPTINLEHSSPKGRRPSRTRAESRIKLFRSVSVPMKVSKLRPFEHNVKGGPPMEVSGKSILTADGKISSGEDPEAPLPVMRASVTNKQRYYRKSFPLDPAKS